MRSLRLFAVLLRWPFAWGLGLLSFVLNLLMLMVLAELADTIGARGTFSIIDTTGYVVLSLGMGIGVYAAFIFPATRRLMRDRVNLARPKVIVWIGVSIAETIFLISMVGALFAISFAAVPNLLAAEQISVLESAFEVLVSPLLMGLYVWKIALICGNTKQTLRAINRFVWSERLIVVAAYFPHHPCGWHGDARLRKRGSRF